MPGRETNAKERILLASELGRYFRMFRRRLEGRRADREDLKDFITMFFHNRKRREALLDFTYWDQEMEGKLVDYETGEVVAATMAGVLRAAGRAQVVDASFTDQPGPAAAAPPDPGDGGVCPACASEDAVPCGICGVPFCERHMYSHKCEGGADAPAA